MSTTGDAPLNLTLPQSADYIDLGVLNANYVAINTLASNHESRLDDAELTVAGHTTTLSSGAVYNSTRWNGRKLYVQSTAPTSGMVEGDVWLKVQ
jgi:hypothetical protein